MSPDARPFVPFRPPHDIECPVCFPRSEYADAVGAAIVLGVLAGAWLGWWAADLAAAWLWP